MQLDPVQLGARALTGTLATLLVLLAAPGPAAAAAGEDTARLRVGHFAAGLGDVVAEVDGEPFAGATPYGEVSDYQPFPAGTSTVTFLPAGAPEGAQPLASVEVVLDPGASGSALIAGSPDRVEAKAFADDLTAPGAGTSRVRLIHLAPGVPAVDARVREGVRLFEDAVYGEATSYVGVPEGAYDLEMLQAGTEQVLLAVRGVTVAAGSVYTLVGTGGGPEPVEVRGFVDAAGVSDVPAGGVAAGLGGTAPGAPAGASGLGAAATALAALLVVGGAAAHVRVGTPARLRRR